MGAGVLPFIGLAITIFINLGTMAYTAGVMSTRLSQVEESVRELKTRSDLVNSLSNKMAGVEAKLDSINQTLIRLERNGKGQ